MPPSESAKPHSVTVVIPVYKGERTLTGVVEEVVSVAASTRTPGGRDFAITEIILVNDNGPDGSAEVMRTLRARFPIIRAVWLSRNYGQHAATLAGLASSGGDWVVTMDEDGQHDPRDIPRLLDTALDEQVPVVYARPVNPPPHGVLRNAASRLAKWVLSVLSGSASGHFSSYRLLLGSTSRSVAAYAGSGVYLDIAIGWIANGFAQTDVTLREEGGRSSGYTLFSLFSHFWRMVLSSGTRALRLVSALGALFALGGIVLAVVLFIERATSSELPDGWTSTIVVMLLGMGAILFSLGVIAEYVGVSVNMAMGRPPYLIVSDPGEGPLGRERARLSDGEARGN